jgi:DNA modification methylase
MTYEIERISTKDLTPYARNARTHSDAQIEQIARSISEFGFNNPVLIDNDNGIIAGHGRVMAAAKISMDEVPCIRLSKLTPEQKKAYILADNRLALDAGWNAELLKLELSELVDIDFDINLLGFSEEELSDILGFDEPVAGLTDEDETPEVADEAITKPGDVWVLGNHRLMCGDSTNIDAVDTLMDGKKADMVFTDPPYGMRLNADFSSAKSNLKMLSEKGLKGGNKYSNVIGDHDDFTPELINTVFASFSYCKEIFLWGADYYSELLPKKNDGSWVVWDKRLDESADKMYGSTFELCWSKSKHKRMIARVKWAGVFGTEKEFDKKRHHPTQKPVSLVCWFFDYYSMEGKLLIVDLYGGSGSTLIACEKTGRHARVMELDPRYCDVIVKRWQNFTGLNAVLESTGETFNKLAGIEDGSAAN